MRSRSVTGTLLAAAGAPPAGHEAPSVFITEVHVLAERPHWRKNIWGNTDVGLGPRGATPSRSFVDVLREGLSGRS